MLVNIAIIADNISTRHVWLGVIYKTVVTSFSICVHTTMSVSESWFTFNHMGD